MVHGVDPILPFDISEHTYIFPTLIGAVSTSELIASRARALQRRDEDLDRVRNLVYHSRLRSAAAFVREYENTIREYDLQPGALVLARNSQIEMEHNQKAKR
jgi:hypothetical protein